MTDESEKSGRRRKVTSRFVGAMLIVLIVYPLSVGPVVVLAVRYQGTSGQITNIYKPLIWLNERVGDGDALPAYIQWWLRVTNSRHLVE